VCSEIGDPDGESGKNRAIRIVRACDIVLPVLLVWQELDSTKPVVKVAAGLVVAVRAAAVIHDER
jgi:hypothetical protein